MGGFLGARRHCVPAGRPARGRRAAGLWALFHAQTLVADTTDATDAFALAEDDRYRLSAERGAEGGGLSLRYR